MVPFDMFPYQRKRKAPSDFDDFIYDVVFWTEARVGENGCRG